jgi:hypothetical protein
MAGVTDSYLTNTEGLQNLSLDGVTNFNRKSF